MSPPSPTAHHMLLRKVVAACVAMLDCLQKRVLGGVFLVICFSLPAPADLAEHYQGEEQNHDMPL